MSGHRANVSDNMLGDFARAHGFSFARQTTWIEAVGLVEKMVVLRHVDMGERESYLGEHPQLGLIAVLVSAVATCFVFANQDPGPALRPQFALA